MMLKWVPEIWAADGELPYGHLAAKKGVSDRRCAGWGDIP
jgi:hypothetical protein